MAKHPFTLLIQSNSPGELTSWVKPIVQEFKSQRPDSRVEVFLTPCQYASGREKEIALEIPGVDAAYNPKETLSVLFDFKTNFSDQYDDGRILYLGGDPFYSRILRKKFKFEADAYTEHHRHPGRFFRNVFFKHEAGDLMKARVARYLAAPHHKDDVYARYCFEKDRKIVLFFPGSRPIHFDNYMEIILDTILEIQKKDRTILPAVLIAPFIKDDAYQQFRDTPKYRDIPMLRGESLDLMSIATMLVTIPGTNNAEAMYMGLPMLVGIPLHDYRYLIVDGILGLIGNIPVLGTGLKRLAVNYMLKKPYVSLPNRMLGRAVVPEFAGAYTPDEFSDEILSQLKNEDGLKAQKAAFTEVSVDDAALIKIVNGVLS